MSSSDALRRLEEWLGGHPLGPDGRLPAERRLAAVLDLSRAELRKALAAIEAEGRLIRHVGRGTFLQPSNGQGPSPGGPEVARGAEWSNPQVWADLTSPRDLLQARLILEPELARLAAVHASRAEMQDLEARQQEVRAARSWERYDVADDQFHRQIARASGNDLLAALHGAIMDVRRAMTWGQLSDRAFAPARDHACLAEHDSILVAIADRDRDSAAEGLRRHLMVESAVLVGPFA